MCNEKFFMTMKKATLFLMSLLAFLLSSCHDNAAEPESPYGEAESTRYYALWQKYLGKHFTNETYGSKRVLKRLKNHKTLRYRSKRVPIVWLFN